MVLRVGLPLKSEGKEEENEDGEQGEENERADNFGKVSAFHCAAPFTSAIVKFPRITPNF
jgi:hypothetical protein